MTSWPYAKPVPQLETNSVHVWAWELDGLPLDSDWSVLSDEETARARRFVYPRDRDRYVCAHANMRTLLSGYIGIDAARINFTALAYGKPQFNLAPGAQPIHFNLTHSANLAALAVSRDYPLGIDVERIRPIDPDIAAHHFSPQELLILDRLPAPLWLAGFYRCWTSKEALLKGEGMGLNLPLDGFDVEVHPDRPAALIAVAPHTNIASAWTLLELKPAEDFVGTLAVHDPAKTFQRTSLQCFSLSR
ncbi:MAG TPA: 4'-phosphopantetheinyl transferase superfamily protein [Acidobacteriaceae bacterium]